MLEVKAEGVPAPKVLKKVGSVVTDSKLFKEAKGFLFEKAELDLNIDVDGTFASGFYARQNVTGDLALKKETGSGGAKVAGTISAEIVPKLEIINIKVKGSISGDIPLKTWVTYSGQVIKLGIKGGLSDGLKGTTEATCKFAGKDYTLWNVKDVSLIDKCETEGEIEILDLKGGQS